MCWQSLPRILLVVISNFGSEILLSIFKLIFGHFLTRRVSALLPSENLSPPLSKPMSSLKSGSISSGNFHLYPPSKHCSYRLSNLQTSWRRGVISARFKQFLHCKGVSSCGWLSSALLETFVLRRLHRAFSDVIRMKSLASIHAYFLGSVQILRILLEIAIAQLAIILRRTGLFSRSQAARC